MSNRTLAVVIAVWAALTWGGRINLITDPEAADPATWLRVGASLVAAAGAVVGLVRVGRRSRALVAAYVAVTAFVWVGSLVSVWTTEHELGFRLVHTGLAAVSLALAGAASSRLRHLPAAAG